MGYSVRKAIIEDLQNILPVYAAARQFMRINGNPNQWGSTNPPEDVLREDIRREQLYVITREGRIRGTFALIPGEDPTYARIYGGSWSSDSAYHTIHRLAGDGSGGIFAACVEYCRERCGYLRIDTHRDNLVMLRLLEKAGFRQCGIIHLLNGDERIAFDLKI